MTRTRSDVMMANRRLLSERQLAILAYVREHPGCTAAEVTRWEWGQHGHCATYLSVARLKSRGYLRAERGTANRINLYVSEAHNG